MSIYAPIYRIAVGAYALVVRIAALFNPKAALFVQGRKNGISNIRYALATEKRPRVWVHCASLGEFEQGRPVIEAVREQYPQYAIVITFFSPSGYEVRKDYKGADHVFYLPVDTLRNATDFLDILNPTLCIFVKYEFWYFYLSAIAARQIPSILISAVFSGEQGFFKWYGSLFRQMLHSFTHIFVQDDGSEALLQSIGIGNVTVSGDTRFDRVIKAAQNTVELPVAEAFCDGYKILVAGSTWRDDEKFLHKVLPLLPQGWKMILVPHEVDGGHIAEIERLFEGETTLWSHAQENPDARVLLIDTVGLLSQLYRFGSIAWIGGAFGKEGVHNVLEAAVYGIPCFYGPIYHQFIEANELIDAGGAYSISDPGTLISAIQDLEISGKYRQVANAARDYVLTGGGATPIVMDFLRSILP